MRLGTAARTVRDGFAETLADTEFPPEHWRRIRTNNGIERINRENRRRTRVVGTFPDGNSALMPVTARLKRIAEHEWGKRRRLNMSKPEEMDELKEKAEGWKRTGARTAKSICERILSVPKYVPRDARLKGRAAGFRHAELGRLLVEQQVDRLLDGLPHQILYILAQRLLVE